MKRFLKMMAVLAALSTLSCEDILLGTKEKPSLPTVHESKFATLLDSLRYALDLPALAGAIVTDTSIVGAQAVGSRRYAGPLNVTVDDKFHLGSNTKAFTAVLIGTLVDEGRVNWTTTLPSIFPELAGMMRPEYLNVTVRDLLSHSSGIMFETNRKFTTGTLRDQRAEFVAWVLTQPPATTRGHHLYSNLGYGIVGAIAEKLTDRLYEELLIERVLEPLGITTAGFGPMGVPDLEDQPLQHTPIHSPIKPTPDADSHPIYSPAGRLHMSIGDWARFAQWVLAAEAGHQTLLRPETARMLTTSVVPTDEGGYYALGWLVSDETSEHGKTLVHGGSNLINLSYALLKPKMHFGVIAATNQGPGPDISENPIGQGINRLIEFYYLKR